MVSGLHLQTALAVSAVWATGLLLWFLRRRQQARSMVTEADRATYETLHTASLAGVEFRDGLTELGAERLQAIDAPGRGDDAVPVAHEPARDRGAEP